MQRLVRLAPVGQSLDLLRNVEAAHRISEAVLKISPPELTVRYHRQADCLLLADHIADRVVLRRAQLGVRRVAAGVPLENIVQRLRCHEAAVLIDAKTLDISTGPKQYPILVLPGRRV